MYGWSGIALDIDLTTGRIAKEEIPQNLLIEYIGGEALGAKLLYDEVPPGTDPFDPKMLFIVATGPLSGTLGPGSGRLEIITKSPLNNLFGDTNTGGEFAPELHWAGYDFIKIHGRADKPVYLWIDDDSVEIRDASHLWGLPHIEAIEQVKRELGDPRIATISIGPAGENKVALSCIYSGPRNAAAMMGAAAVMGAKNLKMIAARGTKGVKIADPVKFEEVCREAIDKMVRGTFYPYFAEEGALGTVTRQFNRLGTMPTRNYQGVMTDDEYRGLSYEAFLKHKVKNLACFGCPLHCKHYVNVKSGPYAGTKMKGVEFYAVVTFGVLVGCYSSDFYIKAVYECDKYGLDMGNTGAILGFAMELYQRGIITKKDTDGLELNWGGEEVLLELIRKIALREGFGNLMADGFDKFAERVGKDANPYNLTVKGMPAGGFEPRVMVGGALSLLTTTNGNALKSAVTMEYGEGMVPKLAERRAREYFDIPSLAPEAVEGKDKVVIWAENFKVLIDSVPGCLFNSSMFGLGLKGGLNQDDYAKLLTAATGVEYDGEKLLKIGEKVYILEMVYDIREGLRREQFILPERFTKEPVPAGSWKGKMGNIEGIYKLLDSYFEKRGFDPKTALPTRKGLERVGLKEVATELQKRGLLSTATTKTKGDK